MNPRPINSFLEINSWCCRSLIRRIAGGETVILPKQYRRQGDITLGGYIQKAFQQTDFAKRRWKNDELKYHYEGKFQLSRACLQA